ncbi:hypothetical protein SAMN04487983_1007113 [Streptomyces sp. yr375]|nr:hypothetical protein SAMN04487983_1007113 [Streptomyces sp. yr375]
MIQRYREVATAFPTSDLPPLETAYWLVKPLSQVHGTWSNPWEAAAWLGDTLTRYAARIAAEAQRDVGHLTGLVQASAERLGSGDDVSLGFYLERPAFLSLAAVACSPNRAKPGLGCPLGPPTT